MPYGVSIINFFILPCDRCAFVLILKSVFITALSPTCASPHVPYSKTGETAEFASKTLYEVSVILYVLQSVPIKFMVDPAHLFLDVPGLCSHGASVPIFALWLRIFYRGVNSGGRIFGGVGGDIFIVGLFVFIILWFVCYTGMWGVSGYYGGKTVF